MNNITLLMVATPAVSLLLVGVALLICSSRHQKANRARLILLRGLGWSFGAVLVAYLSAEALFWARHSFQGFTLATCLPIVVFGTSAATAIWHIRNLKRQAAAVNRTQR